MFDNPTLNYVLGLCIILVIFWIGSYSRNRHRERIRQYLIRKGATNIDVGWAPSPTSGGGAFLVTYQDASGKVHKDRSCIVNAWDDTIYWEDD
jgi:hypothetical protein